jgi:hypothetical protein
MAEPWRIHKPYDGLIETSTWRNDPRAKLVVMTRTDGGKFARFKKGERVIAIRRRRGQRTYDVERVRWRGSIVPLANKCCCVPADALHIL